MQNNLCTLSHLLIKVIEHPKVEDVMLIKKPPHVPGLLQPLYVNCFRP